jgi:hypothetical protein
VFTGSAWNLLGPIPKAKKKKPTNKCKPLKVHGHQFPVTFPGCVTTSPPPTLPTPTNTPSGFPTGLPSGLPTTSTTPAPTSTATGFPTGFPSPTATPTPSASTSHTGFPFGGDSVATTGSGVKAGLAVGGVLFTVLPGSLLWTTTSRRRRKRRSEPDSGPGTGTER